ncbi:hypothetical protein [Nocardia sp. NRRL S-836]|uniref:hypothetical protein n=1 Tax=Nocardia sp. NRRL S-836 TaxID=1519492 RepID=UPI0012F8E270|nr:hypothetical protein [Nocardia sp. NRRL S-836]
MLNSFVLHTNRVQSGSQFPIPDRLVRARHRPVERAREQADQPRGLVTLASDCGLEGLVLLDAPVGVVGIAHDRPHHQGRTAVSDLRLEKAVVIVLLVGIVTAPVVGYPQVRLVAFGFAHEHRDVGHVPIAAAEEAAVAAERGEQPLRAVQKLVTVEVEPVRVLPEKRARGNVRIGRTTSCMVAPRARLHHRRERAGANRLIRHRDAATIVFAADVVDTFNLGKSAATVQRTQLERRPTTGPTSAVSLPVPPPPPHRELAHRATGTGPQNIESRE